VIDSFTGCPASDKGLNEGDSVLTAALLWRPRVYNNIGGEAKPLVAIPGDHLRGVSGEKRERVGR
jgi:hypothetical protein